LPTHEPELWLDLAIALSQLKRWEETRAALLRAGDLPRGTKDESLLLLRRAYLFALVGSWDSAAADYRAAVQLVPEDHWTRHLEIVSLISAGDRDGLLRAGFNLIERFRETTNHEAANQVAWSCVLAPGTIVANEVLVRLAETALKDYPVEWKHRAMRTLGSALYRTGRFDGAIRRLEEGIQLRNGTDEPLDWPFLAMAHHRLGHRDEARRWLDRFRNRQPSTDPNQFWDELEIRLLRSEAEAVVLYDPIFPADPFAH
jgi:tetratricopeptide (TPR) repeat protein